MNSEKVVLQSWYSDEELMRMSSENSELRFERNADGTLETMPPTGGISGNREIKAGAYLLNWVESQDLGEVFSSSTGFRLANTAVRCLRQAASRLRLMLLLSLKDVYQKIGMRGKISF